ncbi:DUF5107 domain-containing protein [Pseudalkalibacillus decolorationis]|uniref:aldose epimerase family protein n=1 Tax=Pseudalkalibacillus decolorationis TaxID=163879 RepID=UPI0021496FB3|nr:DUF5107 domain-containing protein [Pseudalkalibacillus decolorationis]
MIDLKGFSVSTYKGIESITLENDHIRCIILPSYGGKMVSFYDKKVKYEWLYQSNQDFLSIPSYGADFSKYDSSGFDEMFPGIDPGPHPNSYKMIPDHGEVWTLPWSVTPTDVGIEMEVKSPTFPYTLKKSMRLTESGVDIHYEATNTSDESFPFIWAPHALMKLKSETLIDLPKGLSQIINVELNTKHLGGWGTLHSYPKTHSVSTGEPIDLSRLEPMETSTIEKFYFNEHLQEGWCSLVQPDISRKLTYWFPIEKVPFLGVWKTRGGYRGEYNVALEPCTGVYDDVYLAEKIGKSSSIPPYGSYTWFLKIDVGST